MKNLYQFIFAGLALIALAACANGKKLQEKAPVSFKPAYFVQEESSKVDEPGRLKLHIPTEDLKAGEVELDSVYFRGRKAELFTSDHHPNLYVAYFESLGKKPDHIMSSDPQDEYQNEVPVIVNEIPFDLEADEAVVRYKKNGRVLYYKLEGVEERSKETDLKKYPENVQH